MGLDYRTIIADQSARMLEILQAGPADAAVPGTPDWNLAELGAHMAHVQRWSASVVAAGAAPADSGPPVDPANAPVELEAATERLLATLDDADPEAPCWNFGSGPQLTSFWFRRQALEVAVHRWDAESAVSDSPAPIDPEVAADIIDEFLHLSLPRTIDRQGIDLGSVTGDVHLHCTDIDTETHTENGGEWTFEVDDGALVVSDEHRKSAVALRAPAGDLALYVYGRIPVDRIEVFGDLDVLRSWGSAFTV